LDSSEDAVMVNREQVMLLLEPPTKLTRTATLQFALLTTKTTTPPPASAPRATELLEELRRQTE
jgi:hypothetical protein